MSAFFVSFALIFVAELGDKSQLVALWFATRYRWWLVILSVLVATTVVHLGSVAIGASIGSLLPEPVLLTIIGLSFFLFAAWGLRGDSLGEQKESVRATGVRALALITSAFFVSELGDKTQLATISLAGQEDSFVGVWLGSTAGMVSADALAIGIGILMGKRLPDRTIAIVAALLFVGFGLLAIGRAVSLVV
jgi:putative Ca2+/H+ antiporter (TMEM165/GDT1 family)